MGDRTDNRRWHKDDEKFSDDLSFMTDEDWEEAEKARPEREKAESERREKEKARLREERDDWLPLGRKAGWLARAAAQEGRGPSPVLLPCPHCGGRNVAVECVPGMCLAQCSDCPDPFRPTEDEAVAIWNRRAGRPSGEGDMLPCPHCGAEGETQHAFGWWANCSEGCLEQGKTEAEAAALWNRRTT